MWTGKWQMLHLIWNSIYYAIESTHTWPLARSGILVVDVIEMSTSQKLPRVPARVKAYASSENLFILLITEGCHSEDAPHPLLITEAFVDVCTHI